MAYAIIRQEKIQKIKGIKAHNEREYFSDNVDKSKTHKNITLVKNQYKNDEHYLSIKKEQIASSNKINKTKNRMIQKDKSYSTEYIFTHSPGAMSEKESIEYLKLAFNFIKDRFPNNEILGAYIHLDETTPHIHIDMSYFDTKANKFNQRELYKQKLTDIDDLRAAFQNYIEDKGYNLSKQDGTVVKKQEHQTKANKQIKALKEKIKVLNDVKQKEIIKTEIIDNTDYEEIEKLKIEIEELQKSLILARETILDYKTTIDTQKQKINDLEQDIEDLIIDNHSLKQDIRYANREISELRDTISKQSNETTHYEQINQDKDIEEFTEQSELSKLDLQVDDFLTNYTPTIDVKS